MAALCPLAARLYPFERVHNALPASVVLEAHGFDLEDASLSPRGSMGPYAYALLYNNCDVIVDSAASQDDIPCLVERLKGAMDDAEALVTFLKECPTAARVVVIVKKPSIVIDNALYAGRPVALPEFAMAMLFDIVPREIMKGGIGHVLTKLHAPGFDRLFDEMPPSLSELLQLRIMRQALALEPSDRLGPYMFDRLAYHTRCMAVTLQEEVRIERKLGDDGKPLARMGSRFPLLEEVVDISALNLHGALRRAEPTEHVLHLETKLGEALEACGDYSHAGLLYSEVASTYRKLASDTNTPTASQEQNVAASWLRQAATIQFHNAGLAFKRCGSFVQAEVAYVKGMQLVESDKQLLKAVKDLSMVYDALIDAASGAAERTDYLRCQVALACLTGRRPPDDLNLLRQEYVLMKDARKRLLASLPGVATDPLAVRRAILATTNPKTTLVHSAVQPKELGVSDGMRSGVAYSELLKGSSFDTGFCEGCHKVFDLRKLQRCACGADDATYCSKVCQRAHWPIHKLTCITRKANRKVSTPAPTEESLERARVELQAMQLRHDEREAAEATARKAAEKEKRARVAAQRASRDAVAPPASPHPTRDDTKSEKENTCAAVAMGAATPAERAKRQAAKEQSCEAQRAHEAALQEKEDRRIAQAEQQAEMRKLGERIARGD